MSVGGEESLCWQGEILHFAITLIQDDKKVKYLVSKIIEKTWDHSKYEEELYKSWEEKGYFRPEVVTKTQSRDSKAKNNPLQLPLEKGERKMDGLEKGERNESGLEKGKAEGILKQVQDDTNSGQFSYDRKIDGKPFVISMPPPNVTGKLHMGHALFVTLEDIMARYHRLLGEPTLWLPGTDHAGIATQTVVDKALKKEGIDKRELGREKFVERVWQWKEQYGGIITKQMRRLGASCDWSRERFTLDEGLNHAVRKAFVDLYNKDLIYRGYYIVNWCPKCHTAIADDEVEHVEQKAKLYYFKYDKKFPITIASTRPETKLGDVAVAVHPEDKRYKTHIGKSYEVDIDGTKRSIKIIADKAVDKEFGTGALGVTPAHSFVDWQMAEQQDLDKIKIIDENGRMLPDAGEKYAGLKVLEAREKILEYLRSNDLLEKEQEITNNLSVCYRCGGAIEPLPSLQWFVKMKPLAARAKKVVEDGEITIIPKRFEKVYYHWMDNIRDWCISRQLWWGHRLPVWYRQAEISNDQFLISNKIPNPKSQIPNKTLDIKPLVIDSALEIRNSDVPPQEIYVGLEPPQGEGWKQDEDVLDTWFSSALWPFSTLGWPDQTKDYQYFYPTTVMETGYDILFFWVARMIMFGLEFTGRVPFETVYLHGLVRDEQNRKMSKSLGNVMDPLDLIPKYGTDALRMALVVGSAPGQDLPIGEGKIKGYRNFSNKIWNASRYVILRVSEGDLQLGEIGDCRILELDHLEGGKHTVENQRMLDEHKSVKEEVTKLLNNFKFSLAGEKLYEYFWHTFADVYIEETKKYFNELGDKQVKENTKKVLVKVLSESLVMLHPFMPYVTEAVWQDLRQIYPDLAGSIMIAGWPE